MKVDIIELGLGVERRTLDTNEVILSHLPIHLFPCFSYVIITAVSVCVLTVWSVKNR